MIQKIELITKKLTKLINTKTQKEAEIEKMQREILKMNEEIIEAETQIIDLIKMHQKEIKVPKKRAPKKSTAKIEEPSSEE